MAERIRELIRETEGWLADHRRRRDTAPTRGIRTDAGIEAAGCTIRLKALRECLAIVERS